MFKNSNCTAADIGLQNKMWLRFTSCYGNLCGAPNFQKGKNYSNSDRLGCPNFKPAVENSKHCQTNWSPFMAEQQPIFTDKEWSTHPIGVSQVRSGRVEHRTLVLQCPSTAMQTAFLDCVVKCGDAFEMVSNTRCGGVKTNLTKIKWFYWYGFE